MNENDRKNKYKDVIFSEIYREAGWKKIYFVDQKKASNTVISFFEQSAEDVEEPILKRLDSTETILRRSCDASLLLQSIIDAIVDLAIPLKDAYNKARKELQVDALVNPNIATSRSLHIFGEEIDML